MRPLLPRPQPGDRDRVGGVDQQLEPAESLERDDATGTKRARRRGHGGGAPRELPPVAIDEAQQRTTCRTGNRLGVEAAVAGIGVLADTLPTGREAPHRRARPVVRETLDDRVARTAARAIGERIPIPPRRRVAGLRVARVARREVGGERGAGDAVDDARDDPEALHAHRRQLRDLDAGDVRGRWSVASEHRDEVAHHGSRSLDLEVHAVAPIGDPAREAALDRGAVDERPEADALHHARDVDRDADHSCTAVAMVH